MFPRLFSTSWLSVVHSKWLQSLQDHYFMKKPSSWSSVQKHLPCLCRLTLLAANPTWTLANTALVYLGRQPPTDALLICQLEPLLLRSLLCTLGAPRCPSSALCLVQTRVALRLKPSYLLHHTGGPHLPGVHSPVDTAAKCFLSTSLTRETFRNKKPWQNQNNKRQLLSTSAVSAAAGKASFRRRFESNCLVAVGGATVLALLGKGTGLIVFLSLLLQRF